MTEHGQCHGRHDRGEAQRPPRPSHILEQQERREVPEVEAVAVPPDQGDRGVRQQPVRRTGSSGVAGADQDDGGDDGQRDADEPVARAAARRSEHDVGADRGQGKGRPHPVPWLGRAGATDEVQRQGSTDQQLGRAGGRAEVEPVGRERCGAAVQHRGSDHRPRSQSTSAPARSTCGQQHERPGQVEVPLDRQRPGVRERVQRR